MNTTYLPFYRRKWKLSTRVTNEDRLRAHLTPLFDKRSLASLTRNELQDLLEGKARTGRSHSVVAHLRWDLCQILRMAVTQVELYNLAQSVKLFLRQP